MSFNVGDWVYHDYELCQVVRIDGERVKEVTTGIISTSSYELMCFPLTIKIKRISDNWMYCERKIRDADGGRRLNWPGIHRSLVQSWKKAVDVSDDGQLLQAEFDACDQFVRDVIEGINSAKKISVGGVAIF
ncbi:MAG: hypothetical protein ACRCTX_05205 [Afipia sp.]